MNQHLPADRMDDAVKDRLAQLRTRPVDISTLQAALEQALPQSASSATLLKSSAARVLLWRKWRMLSSSAAAILIALALSWVVLSTTSSQAVASPPDLAQIHYDVAHGLSPHMQVTTIPQANAILADQSNEHVPLPAMPGQIQSCCLHQHAGTSMTCAMIEMNGQRITIALAASDKLKSPKGQTVTRQGRTFILHKANGINMVMSEQGRKWLCVMGEAPFEKLLEVAADIHPD